MKTLDFTKYAGTYNLKEAKEIANKMTAEILELEIHADLERTKEMYPKYTAELVIHPKKGGIDLSKLSKNQRVCASQVKGYYTLLTQKADKNG